MQIEPLITTFQEVPVATTPETLRVALANHQLTPSRGLIAETVRYLHEHETSLDVLVSAAPERSEWNDAELNLMEADLFTCQELGADGVIIGATTKAGQLDYEGLAVLIGAADGMELFFSPAITQLPESEWATAFQWLSEQQFSGIVATDHLTALSEALSAFPTLQLIPLVASAEEQAAVNNQLHPHRIITPLS
ncbi:hypothetical protein M3M35_02395 [Fructilactobacillus myrtifloralis]|uniref:Copper resistance protein n=1 Tax=Fructilactobacillus myrtifloralis TaxID=2940301 RepID=A0ABY5BPQ0_9LACO|nr:copper homeostasis protein CutC [Fructilactobacillus myrtifloralis]USS85535.1 hypothetical protein M3M35_02395 [Fructilactobacillus myrtifloralis]